MIMPNGLMSRQRTMTGAELKETVRAFVEGCEGGFVPFNRGSLPVVSGIAVEVKENNGSYTLTGITRNGQPLGDNDTVTVTCLATEKQMEALHETLKGLESELADPGVYGDGSKSRLKEILGRQAEAKVRLEGIEAEWLDVSETVETMEEELAG